MELIEQIPRLIFYKLSKKVLKNVMPYCYAWSALVLVMISDRLVTQRYVPPYILCICLELDTDE